MTLITAVEDLFKSFYELLASVFGAAYSVVHAALLAVFNFFSGLVGLVTDIFSGAVDVVGGVGKFVTGNIVVLGVIAAGAFLYVRYAQQQGKPVVPAKKTA